MLLLAGTSAVLKLVTGQAKTVDTHVSYVDSNSTPATENHNVSTATTTTICAAPGSGVQRNIEEVWVTNKDVTSCDCTLQHTDGTTTVQIGNKVTLAPGESIQIDKYGKVHRLDATLAKYVTGALPGRFVKSTLFVSGTTMNLGATTNTIRCRLVGGGGGGGGCTSVSSAAGVGGGGGAGGYAEKSFAVTPGAAVAYAIGGAGAANSGAAGGNGGDTTVTVGATVTAKGGTGGTTTASATTLTASAGGAGGVVGSNGDVNASGDAGKPGVVLIVATPIGASGNGGSGPFGAGGVGIIVAGAGVAGTGNGSGGSGGLTGAAAARAGGAGTVGCLIIDEYT